LFTNAKLVAVFEMWNTDDLRRYRKSRILTQSAYYKVYKAVNDLVLLLLVVVVVKVKWHIF